MANNQLSINLGLDIVPISKDPENVGDIYRLYNAVKLVASGLDQYSGAVGADATDWSTAGTAWIQLQNLARLYVQFNATVTTGQLIALNSSGQAVLGTAGNVIGWAPTGVTSGQYGEVRLLGLHTAITGMTPGQVYYASNSVAGGITAGPPLTEGYRVQEVGFAIASNKLFFCPKYFAPYIRTAHAASMQDGLTHKLLSSD